MLVLQKPYATSIISIKVQIRDYSIFSFNDNANL